MNPDIEKQIREMIRGTHTGRVSIDEIVSFVDEKMSEYGSEKYRDGCDDTRYHAAMSAE